MSARGLDPTLGAILPLIGVLLGALAAGGVTYLLRLRDERTELRAIARVLIDELESTADYLYGILTRADGLCSRTTPRRASTGTPVTRTVFSSRAISPTTMRGALSPTHSASGPWLASSSLAASSTRRKSKPRET
jgi:hypothetical protein